MAKVDREVVLNAMRRIADDWRYLIGTWITVLDISQDEEAVICPICYFRSEDQPPPALLEFSSPPPRPLSFFEWEQGGTTVTGFSCDVCGFTLSDMPDCLNDFSYDDIQDLYRLRIKEFERN